MAETPEQRRQRYLRDRQLKGRGNRRTAVSGRRLRFTTGGEWTGGDEKEQYVQDKTLHKEGKAAQYRFIDESIKVMRREYTEQLRKKLADLRAKMETLPEDQQEQVKEAIRQLYKSAHEQRQRLIRYRAGQREVVRTGAAEQRMAADAARGR